MRRRHEKNPLLMRIIGISILVHIIVLPILAYFGAFKKLQRHFLQTTMVVLPTQKLERQKEVRPHRQVVHHTPAAKRSTSVADKAHSPAQKAQPHAPVVASIAGPGDGNGPTIDPNGTGVAGQLPGNNTGPKNSSNTQTIPPTNPQDTHPKPPTAPVAVVQPTAPASTQRAAPVVQPAPPRAPVFTAAQPLPGHEPQPAIPDDLRDAALDKTCVAEFTVSADGAPVSVQIVQSSGTPELDQLAVAAARGWRFTPATRDGVPVEGHVRLHIEFQVS